MNYRKHAVSGAILALSTVAASAALAAPEDGLYFAPSLSYLNSDHDRAADNGAGLLLGLGKQLSEKWNMELSIAADNLDAKAGGATYKQRGLQLDGLYFFDRTAHFSPYGVVGAGVLNTNFDGFAGNSSANNAMVNAGVGVMHNITDSGIKLRGDVRYRLDDDNRMAGIERFGDWMVNVGLVIPFGGKSAPAVAVAAPAVVAAVAPAPAPEPEVAPAPVPEPLVAPVVKTEPVDGDSDNDGVKDSLDSCPDTKAGARVDSKGCELADVIVLKGVNFGDGSAKLTDGSEEVLNDVAATLMKYSTMVVEVSGHTSNTGSAKLNHRLSQQRAESVVHYLVAKGVNPANLKAKGYGPDKPVADNATAAGRAANRRVELHILQR